MHQSLEHGAGGAVLVERLLFLHPDRYVSVLLEPTSDGDVVAIAFTGIGCLINRVEQHSWQMCKGALVVSELTGSYHPSSLPLSLARHVNKACDRFEEAWKGGGDGNQRPRLEDYLEETPEPARPVLLCELVALDILYRRQAGEEPKAADYARFPTLDTAWLVQVVAGPPATNSPESPVETDSESEVPSTNDSPIPLPPTDDLPAEVRSAASRPFLAPGTLLDQCRIEKRLGRGGMGEVYLARQVVMDKQVAVKVLPVHLAEDAEAFQRFLKEIQVLARLDPHPHVATAFHASQHQGRYYLVMEYVAGTDLKQYVKEAGPLPVAQACAFIRQISLGLEYLHQHDIVHRDLKPSNVMVTPDQTLKILDLGLARHTLPGEAGTDPSLTPAGILMGTLDYLAPEQARDARKADARSDLYSLGCTFYHLLTGRPPFEHCSSLEKIAAHARDVPEPIQGLRPDVPAAVAAVVDKLLAKRPAARYPAARAVIEALDAATGSVAVCDQPGRKRLTPRHRKWAAVLFAALALLAGGVGLVVGMNHFLRRPSHPETLDDLRIEKMIVLVRHRGNIARHDLVLNGMEQPLGPWELLEPSAKVQPADRDGLRLEGQFHRPTYWYLLWFDTAGELTVADHSQGEQSEVEVPMGSKLKTINPRDPLGVHLLLLVAGKVAPEPGTARLQDSLGKIGPPPNVLPPHWASGLRGAGEDVALGEELPSNYLKRIREDMPPEFKAMYALFFKTAKPAQ